MGYLTEQEYEARLEKIKKDNESKERKLKLKEEKKKYKTKFKLPPTSKLILIGVALLCLEIIAFCEYIIIRYYDSNAIYVLVGIPATLIPIILGYFNKSRHENTAGGITYDMAMHQYNQQNNFIDGFGDGLGDDMSEDLSGEESVHINTEESQG